MNVLLNYIIYVYSGVLTILFVILLLKYIKVKRNKRGSNQNIETNLSGKSDCEQIDKSIFKISRLGHESESLKDELSQLNKNEHKGEVDGVRTESNITQVKPSNTFDKEDIYEQHSSSPFASVNILYAGSFNIDEDAFYSIKDAPTEKTLFILTIDKKNNLVGEVEIYPEAIDKILGCKDLLDGVCDYSGSGNVLIIEKKGKAILKDNNWRIDQKMIIKFVEK